ncbi:MAG: translation initiation factor eIF-1A [bacterium]|nr:translation initiation factor eIF-1A [bacterium]
MCAAKKKRAVDEEEEIKKIQLPKGNQVLGIVVRYLGARQMIVRCLDGVERLCKISRKYRGPMIREGDVVLVEPWQYTPKKGDVLLKYTPLQVEWLKKQGYLKEE